MQPCWPGCHSSRAETMWVSQGNNECFHTLPWKLTEQPSHQLRACFSLEWPLSNLTFQLFFWILVPFRHLAVAPAKEAGIKMALEWVMGLRSWISHPCEPGDTAPIHEPDLFLSPLPLSFSPLLSSPFFGPALMPRLSTDMSFHVGSYVSRVDLCAHFLSPVFPLFFFPFAGFKLLSWLCPNLH